MDARQGVNTEEQHDLLKLAKDNLAKSKTVPLIVVSNKVDDPENDEQKALLDEARDAVAKLFRVSNRQDALKAILASSDLKKSKKSTQVFPVVVPVSAMHAFVYRCGSRLSYEDFCKMDSDFIDKIGKDSYGRQWRRFDKQKQLKKAFEAVSEDEQRQDGIDASNFGTFIKVLSICIGDEDHQTTIIEKQIKVALDRMKEGKPNSDLGAELLLAHKNLTALQKSIDHLPAAFWSSYEGLRKKAFADFETDFSVVSFANPIDHLFNYTKALKVLRWPGEMDKIVSKAKELVLQYAFGVTASDEFKSKAEADQSLVLGSMLLASSEIFNMHFGFLKLHLESKYDPNDVLCKKGYCPTCNKKETEAGTYGQGTEYCSSCRKIYVEDDALTSCPACQGASYTVSWETDGTGQRYATCMGRCSRNFYLKRCVPEMKVVDGKLVPVDEVAYKKSISVTVSDSLKDPNHFGYVLWKCCQLLREVSSGSA